MSKIGIFLRRLAEQRWFAYLSVLLIQMKVIWGLWAYRDLPFADTSFYFVNAQDWHRKRLIDVLWSPLYTTFYSAFVSNLPGAYAPTVAHRVVIVLAATLLVLFVMRRLLPEWAAWLVAVWWAILPINYDTLYEVHLFSFLPWMLALAALLRLSGPLARGTALAILIAAAFLLRLEAGLMVLVFGAVALVADWQSIRSGGTTRSKILKGYGIPVMLAMVIVLYYYAHDRDPQAYREITRAKHVVNVCQVYAFGYQQRHTDWKGSPWTQCSELMKRDFGNAEPTLIQALRLNPRAMMEHFLWNLRLVPSGLQVGLFNAASGPDNPDYTPVNSQSKAASLLSLLVGAIVLAGFLRMKNNSTDRAWLAARTWAYVFMASALPLFFVVVLTQRPRPSYLFFFSAVLMAITGTCAAVLFGGQKRLFKTVQPVIAVLLLLFLPAHYSEANPREVLKHYERLSQFESLLYAKYTVFVSDTFPTEMCNYIGYRRCTPVDLNRLGPIGSPQELAAKLASARATLLYFSESSPQLNMLEMMAPLLPDWSEVVRVHAGSNHWHLFQRKVAAAVEPARDILAPGTGDQALALGDHWYPFERAGNDTFRWVANDCTLLVPPSTEARVLKLQVEPGPGVGSGLFTLLVFDQSGRRLLSVPVRSKEWVQVPLARGPEMQTIRLHTDEGGRPTPNDPRTLNFRIFKAEIARQPK